MLYAGGEDKARSTPARPTAPILSTSLRFHTDMHLPTLIAKNRSVLDRMRLSGAECKKILQSVVIRRRKLLQSWRFCWREQADCGALGWARAAYRIMVPRRALRRRRT